MLFEPDHIAPAAVFVAGIVMRPQQPEAQLPVQGSACIVRHGYDTVGRADALLLEQRQKRPVEPCAEAPSRRVF